MKKEILIFLVFAAGVLLFARINKKESPASKQKIEKRANSCGCCH